MTERVRRPSPGLILTATVSAAVLVMANVSALNVALPELSRELSASQTDVHWMVDIYSVALAALLLPAGAIGDRFGRRSILLVGLVVVLASNAVVVFMDTASPVIIARGVSGVGAALIFPSTLSTITATLPVEKRSRGVALWTAAVLVGGILGILGSGLLIENYWWGSTFLGMAAAALVVLVVCWLWVPDSSDPDEAHLDPLGAVLSMVGVGAVVLGIVEGPAEGWTSTLSLYPLIGGSAALALFVAWEWRAHRPLLDVRLFASAGLRAGSVAIFVQFLAAFGFFFVAVFYLAFVLGYGPLDTGLGLLPVGMGVLPAAVVAIPLARRFGRAPIGLLGLCTAAAGFIVGLTVTADTGFWRFGTVLILFGVGLGLSSPPATEAIVESLPIAKQGVASALNDVLREAGAAIGIAVVGAAFNAGYRRSVAETEAFPPEVVEAVQETPAAAAVLAPDLGEGAPALLDHVRRSVLDGWDRSMWVLVGVVFLGAVFYFRWARAAAVEGRRPRLLDGVGPVSRPASAAARPAAPTAAGAVVSGPATSVDTVESGGAATTAVASIAASVSDDAGDEVAVGNQGGEETVEVAMAAVALREPAFTGPRLNVAVIAGADATNDVEQLRRCVSDVDAQATTVGLQLVPDDVEEQPDVVVGLHVGSTQGLDLLARIADSSINGSGPEVVSFIRVVEPDQPSAIQALDAALMWDARQRLQAAGVRVVLLGDDAGATMRNVLVESLPSWAERAGLADPEDEAAGDDGARTPEAAGDDARPVQAESDAGETINQLVPVFVRVSRAARRLLAQSQVPDDLASWPEAQRTRVFSRAAAALHEPVGHLADDAAALVEQVGRVARGVYAAQGRDPDADSGQLAPADRSAPSSGDAGDDFERRLARVRGAAERLVGAATELASRFRELADSYAELAPISRQLDGVEARCRFAAETVDTWA